MFVTRKRTHWPKQIEKMKWTWNQWTWSWNREVLRFWSRFWRCHLSIVIIRTVKGMNLPFWSFVEVGNHLPLEVLDSPTTISVFYRGMWIWKFREWFWNSIFIPVFISVSNCLPTREPTCNIQPKMLVIYSSWCNILEIILCFYFQLYEFHQIWVSSSVPSCLNFS